MIEGVQEKLFPNQPFKGPVLDQLHEELSRRIPLDKLQERRSWRDRRLAALTQLKERLNAEDGE